MYHLSSAVLVSTYVVCSTYVLLVVLMFLTLTQVLGTLHSKGSKKSKGVICLKEDPLKCGHLHRSWIHSDSSLRHFTFWSWNLRETSIEVVFTYSMHLHFQARRHPTKGWFGMVHVSRKDMESPTHRSLQSRLKIRNFSFPFSFSWRIKVVIDFGDNNSLHYENCFYVGFLVNY